MRSTETTTTGVLKLLGLSWAGLFLSIAAVNAADLSMTEPVYQMPPKHIADLVDAPPTPFVSVSPKRQWILVMDRPNLPPIAEIAQPEVRVAGIRINPRTNGPSRQGHLTGLSLKNLATGTQRRIKGVPDDPRISDVRWSPDARKISFLLTRESGIELWVADLESGTARNLTDARVNDGYRSAYSWAPDSRSLLARFVVENRGPVPAAPEVPGGPVIQQNMGKVAPARTYQDLLNNPHDETLFDYYVTSQVMRVTLDGHVSPLGKPGIIVRAEPSPDGKFVLVERIHRPYSYLVPLSRFPVDIEIWHADGSLRRRLAEIPLAEEVPVSFSAVRTGPRSFDWRQDADATVYWVEAQDGGDPKVEVEVRDKVFTLTAPFEGSPAALVSLGHRFGGMNWANDGLALASEWWWQTRHTRTWRVRPGSPDAPPELIFDRSWEDRYNDPGDPVEVPTPAGTRVLLTTESDDALFLAGAGASPEGDRPFLDRLDLDSKETTRLWRSEAPYYEQFVSFVDVEKQIVLTGRESIDEPRNYYKRRLDNGTLEPVTDFPHPTPQLVGVQKELIRYDRRDGVKLTATLYLPPKYKKEDGALPLLMWAYPQEFKSADAAGQVTDSPYRFVRVGWWSALLWLTHGYAVLDDPAMPIIGEGDAEPNDTYVEQLVASAQAAVDEVVRRGVADRHRIAVGGHSYGAFMTANVLAHCDLFRAGIARSGAYNRTLTPFSFQSEERTLWEAPEVYVTMSPFMHANKINEPILLIHGEADSNSGTYPMQSERFYDALKGHGATARLVMLPHESHGYRARESIMHMLWEMTEWLDRYVKNAAPPEPATSPTPEPAETTG